MSPAEAGIEEQITHALRRVVAATSREERADWSAKFTTLVNERNAYRTPRQIAALESTKGLR